MFGQDLHRRVALGDVPTGALLQLEGDGAKSLKDFDRWFGKAKQNLLPGVQRRWINFDGKTIDQGDPNALLASWAFLSFGWRGN